jgi:hypothetical protein
MSSQTVLEEIQRVSDFYTSAWENNMKKILAPLLLLASAIASHADDEIKLENAPLLGVAYGDNGQGFVKIDNIEVASDCNASWVWVPDPKTMALFLTARSTGMNLAYVVIAPDIGVNYHASFITNTDCMIKSVRL